jgi:hypothetical protein
LPLKPDARAGKRATAVNRGNIARSKTGTR